MFQKFPLHLSYSGKREKQNKTQKTLLENKTIPVGKIARMTQKIKDLGLKV